MQASRLARPGPANMIQAHNLGKWSSGSGATARRLLGPGSIPVPTLADVGRRRPGYAPDLGWNLWNLIATVGAGLIACSIVLFVLNVLQSSIGGERAGP